MGLKELVILNDNLRYSPALFERIKSLREAIEQVFSGTADFGRKVTCTISRNGDLNIIGSKSINTKLMLVC